MTKYTEMWERVEGKHKPTYGKYFEEYKKSVNMREVIFLGRGGEGMWMAGELLCSALINMGKYAKVIFMMTGERRGALTRSYIRYADAPTDFPAAYIYKPDELVIGDYSVRNLVSLITDVDVPAMIRRMEPDSLCIINSSKPPQALDLAFAGRLAAVDATNIALKVLGNEFFVNMALVGAYAAATGVMELSFLQQCMKEYRNPRGRKPFSGKAGEVNLEAARLGFEGLRFSEAK